MSVLIKGMEMPENCEDCPFYAQADRLHENDDWCFVLDRTLGRGTDKEINGSACPLVEVPAPHGSLIDADALFEKVPAGDIEHDVKISRNGAIADMCLLILSAPTVIEAEEEG